VALLAHLMQPRVHVLGYASLNHVVQAAFVRCVCKSVGPKRDVCDDEDARQSLLIMQIFLQHTTLVAAPCFDRTVAMPRSTSTSDRHALLYHAAQDAKDQLGVLRASGRTKEQLSGHSAPQQPPEPAATQPPPAPSLGSSSGPAAGRSSASGVQLPPQGVGGAGSPPVVPTPDMMRAAAEHMRNNPGWAEEVRWHGLLLIGAGPNACDQLMARSAFTAVVLFPSTDATAASALYGSRHYLCCVLEAQTFGHELTLARCDIESLWMLPFLA
jgi:hypothetical protein